ncbi:uncharacterized protein DDB_G0286299-like [Clytia hemisphaerica]|uniref:uncharacterized protein DDB_G0286299-like n=1 Tax=Clytia hemisphaerica TaxID=252671 RepID=UPI0034D56D35
MPPDFNMKPGSHVWCVHRTFSKGQRLAEAVILEDVKDENLYKLCLLKHVSRKHTLVLPKNNYQDLPGITKKEKLALLENGDIFYISKTNTSPLKLNNRPSKKKQLHNDTTTDNNKERPKIKLLSKKIEMEEQENQKRKEKIKAKKAAAKNENARQPQTKRVKSSDGEKADKEKEKEETRKTTAEKRPKAKYDPNILIPKFMEATKEPEKDLSSTPKLPTTPPSKPSEPTTSTITKQKPGYTYTYQPPVNIYQELVVPEGATRKMKAKKLESD